MEPRWTSRACTGGLVVLVEEEYPIKSQCPKCAEQGRDTAGDNLHTYDNGWSTCHACDHRIPPSGKPLERKAKPVTNKKYADPLPPSKRGDFKDIAKRKLKEATCRRYGYTVSGNCHIAPYYKEGELVGHKVRNIETKNFVGYGGSAMRDAELFGQHLFDRGGKRVIVTEGEIDCLSVYQTIAASTKSEWAVVSIKNGASGDEKGKASKVVNEIKRSYEWLNTFEEVVLCFDDDVAGQQSAQACAKLFPPGKAHVTQLRYNDPNEYLMKGQTQQLWKDLWNSPQFIPQGIVALKDIVVTKDIGDILTYSSPVMTAKMLGRKIGTMTGVLSGTGSGKTTFVFDQMMEDVFRNNIRVGGIFLESTVSNMKLDIAGMILNQPVRAILYQRKLMQLDSRVLPEFPDTLDNDELDNVLSELDNNTNLHMYDHWGEGDEDSIIEKMEYLVSGLGCQSIILDHMNLVNTNDEGALGLEKFTKRIQGLTKRLPAHFMIISQLAQTDGKSWEEGRVPVPRDMRGTQNVPGTFDELLAITRDQTAEDEEDRNTVYFHSLKGRDNKFTGLIECRQYDKATGRLAIEGEVPQPYILETENV